MNAMKAASAEGYTLAQVVSEIERAMDEHSRTQIRAAEAMLREADGLGAEEYEIALDAVRQARQPTLFEGIRGVVKTRVGAGNDAIFHAMFDMAVNRITY